MRCTWHRCLTAAVTGSTRYLRAKTAASAELVYVRHFSSAAAPQSAAADDSAQSDVLVCGGGIAGLATALCLCTDQRLTHLRRVTVLDTATPPSAQPHAQEEFSARTVALNAGSYALLRRLGVWSRLTRYGSVRHMQVWESHSDAMIRFSSRDDPFQCSGETSRPSLWSALSDCGSFTSPSSSTISGSRQSSPSSLSGSRQSSPDDLVDEEDYAEQEPALAYVVENRVLVGAMMEQLRELNTCRILHNSAAVSSIHSTAHSVDVRLVDGYQLRTSLLIGADGAASTVRNLLNIDNVGWTYNQRAVVAVLAVTSDDDVTDDVMGGNTVAWQRFLSGGPLALLPLSRHRSALVWSCNESEARRLMALGDEQFVDALNSALWTEPTATTASAAVRQAGATLQRVLTSAGLRSPSGPRQMPPPITSVVSGSRATFPLSLQHAARYVSRRTALVGDAAHRLHPLAGQGANLALADVRQLVDGLAKAAAELGSDLGSAQTLLYYEKRRQRAILPMLAMTDALCRLYGSESSPVVLARSLGLQVCDAITPVRRELIRRASC